MPLLFEFKARCDSFVKQEEALLALHPVFKGTDLQRDTYFNVSQGRLKLREGNIENALIHYHRSNEDAARTSQVSLYKHEPSEDLKSTLIKALGIKIIVEKTRKIYFVGNVKIHFDHVEGLGHFIEVEAISDSGEFTADELKEQCQRFYDLFGITPQNLTGKSYSDLLLEKNTQ
jgi:adenylate cyclase, class 2